MFKDKSKQGLEPQRQGGQGGQIERSQRSPLAYERGTVLSPFGLMRRMMEDMDRMFWDFGSGGGGSGLQNVERGFGSSVWAPQVEVFQREGNLVVRADLPGMKENDIHVNLEDDALVIQGERRSEQEREEGGVFHSERSYGSFQRRIALPRGIDANTCDASFENGVLEVKLKMPTETGAKKIQVRAGTQGLQGTQSQGQGTMSGQGSGTKETGSKQVRGTEERENGTQAPPARH
jgi:HSP20 family protein